MKVAIIGCGNMGRAIAEGLAKGSLVNAADITVSNPHEEKLNALNALYPDIKVTTDNRCAADGADVIMLCVKPWKIDEVINEIKPDLDYAHQVIASVAGGIDTAHISECLERGNDDTLPAVFCIIPNTAIAVGSSMTFLTSVRSTQQLDEQLLAIFNELGKAMLVDENHLNAGMALASCGIAYAMRYIRAATEGGVELGFYAKEAQEIVMQTLRGAVDLLAATGNHPEAEIDKVTTPGGLTIKGLNAMERFGFTNAVIKGLKAPLRPKH